MYLAELELHGFKSFAQKTSVKFDSGITAIVGPNGCGKSNIVDALRWVLGEQRPSLLRSSSMSNVIFNGSSSRKPLGLAEVSVTIHNNKNILPTEYTDVTLTRRLYRSGDSEYLLNKTVCRLKDIIELFMDTGMGSNAYSVIELKMVEEILSDKNADRRRLFEEAAGITKYKDRRKLTQKKLEETRNDILRVEDILLEIRKQTRSLQLQAEKAEKARIFKERLDTVELALAYHEYEDLKSQLAPHLEKISVAERSKEELGIVLEQGEEGIKEARTALAYVEIARDKKASELTRLNNLVREHETTLRISLERIQNEERTIKQYDDDISQADQEILEIKRRIEQAEASLAEAEERVDEAAFRKKEAELQFEQRRTVSLQLMTGIRELADKQQHLGAELSAIHARKIKIESRLESLLSESDRLGAQHDTMHRDLQQIQILLQENDILLRRQEGLFEEAELHLEEKREEKELLLKRLNDLKDLLRSKQSRLDAIESEIALLNSVAASHDSFPAGVQFLLSKRSDFSLLEPVSEILSTNEAFAPALEAALGPIASFLVVNDLRDAEHAMEMLRTAKKGKVTFIPLQLLPSEPAVKSGSLAEQVRCSPKFNALKQFLLGQIILTGDLKEARMHAAAPGKTAVTMAGELVNGSVFHRGGSTAPGEGVRLALKDRSEKLDEEATHLENELADLQRELTETDRKAKAIDLALLTQQFREKERQFETLRRDRGVLQTRHSLFESSYKEQSGRSETLVKERTELLEKQALLEPELVAVQARFDEVIRLQSEKRSEHDRVEENRNRAQVQYNEMLNEWQKAQGTLDNLKKDIERGTENIRSIKNRLTLRSEMAHESRDKIVELRAQVVTVNNELAVLKERRSFAEEDVHAADAEVRAERQKIERIETDLQKARKNRDKAVEQFHYLQTIKTQMDVKMTAIADFVWDAYGVLTDQISHRLEEGLSPESARSEVNSLKAKLRELGEVNPLAIDEYKTEKERLDFMEGQINDLKSAELKLHETIQEINQTAQARFNETFEQIRTNFREVFKTLFEENDECDLLLEEDPDDPLDSKIEILAKPRGKRPSTIMQLSGGEKTLTAIALLFAIYLVKPSPFCILDEVDAPLDDANIERFGRILKRFSNETQFIVITHNKKTMEKAHMMYGVTMPEAGVSKLVGVRIGEL